MTFYSAGLVTRFYNHFKNVHFAVMKQMFLQQKDVYITVNKRLASLEIFIVWKPIMHNEYFHKEIIVYCTPEYKQQLQHLEYMLMEIVYGSAILADSPFYDIMMM